MSKTTFKPFDAADHLKSEADTISYLAEVAADGDPEAMALALGDVARARRGMSKLARDTGLSREGLHKALSSGGNPSFGTVVKVASALGHPLVFSGVVAARSGATSAAGRAKAAAGKITVKTAKSPARIAAGKATRTTPKAGVGGGSKGKTQQQAG